MDKPWYKDGLAFRCTRCGNCCTGEPGFVWVDTDEIQALADFLKLQFDEVYSLYTRRHGQKRSLREKSNHDCVFYDREKGCTVYSVRPRQCQTWPFWERNVQTEEDWKYTCEVCPGSGQGELISEEEITRRINVIRI